MRQILVVNKSTVVPDADFKAALAAVQKQIDRDFAPLWGLAAQLVPAQADDPAKESLLVLDDADQAGALGYHEEINDVPKGFVFARTSQQYNDAWQATLSHEVLEQLADPLINLVAVGVPYNRRPVVWAYESCDPVENDEYAIDGVPVSNFVLPSWFSPEKAAKYDFLSKLKAPGTLSPGGYASMMRSLGHWTQIFGDEPRHHQFAPDRYSRRRKRHTLRSHQAAA